MRWFGTLALALLLAACGRESEPQPARPAFWMVEGPTGEKAWLFGTIHSLDRPVEWRSMMVTDALLRADRIVVEIDNLADDAAMAATFTRLATSPDQPRLSERVRPDLRGKLSALLERGAMTTSQFDGTETWAAALILARIGAEELDARNGIDRAVIEAADGRPVVELEGADGQLGIFDGLPENEQRDLLNAVVADTDSLDGESERLADTWRRGDMLAIEQETHTGLLSDPQLREALFSGRNRSWVDRIVAMLGRGWRPFVAVGAAHMAGPEGLPAMLEAKGYKVTRVQ